MNYLSKKLLILASWKVATLSFFSMLACAAVLGSPWSPVEPLLLLSGLDIPDAQPFRTSASLYKQLALYGPSGIHLYMSKVATIDLFLPVLQAAFLSSATSLTIQKQVESGSELIMLNLVPGLALISDYSENMSLAWILHNYPRHIHWLAELAMFFTASKFLFSAISLLILLVSTASLVKTAVHPSRMHTIER